eukprot:9254645-Pyramimonas_sp.AAC.1
MPEGTHQACAGKPLSMTTDSRMRCSWSSVEMKATGAPICANTMRVNSGERPGNTAPKSKAAGAGVSLPDGMFE